jgi:thiol-disulfide isomerase/thioredoxin
MEFRLTYLTGSGVTLGVLVAACSGVPVGSHRARPEPLFPTASTTLQLVATPVPVPALTFEDINGRTWSMRDSDDKVTLVNFWATWCGPCRQEIPDLIKLQEHYRDHVQIIGVSTDEAGPEKVRAFARDYGINYPIVMSTPDLTRTFPGVFALPTSFTIDRQHRVVQTHVGLISPAVFEQEIRHLTALSTDLIVETVEDTQHVKLANAAHATEIPGLDLSELTPQQREVALQRLNEESCICGCELTLAQCRINDAACGISLPLAKQLVAKIAKQAL